MRERYSPGWPMYESTGLAVVGESPVFACPGENVRDPHSIAIDSFCPPMLFKFCRNIV
jgi:hypothetical protein